MIIVKMNNSTLECSIAASELREIGLTPEAIMSGGQTSHNFMSQLNKEVGEQLEINPEQEVLLMSKNMMADGSVRIFAVKMSNEDIQRTADRIRASAMEMLSLVEQGRIDEIKEMDPEEKGEALGSMFMDITEQVNRIYIPEEQDVQGTPSAVSKPMTDYERYMITLKSLEDVRRFARICQGFPVKASALYKADDRYYMVMKIRNEDDNMVYEFRKACVEYADELMVDSPLEAHITETADCLIAEDAVTHLAAL
ncbi:MAG: adaptor protein MecA [Lachnospiraceae bacterium]|nr:adaptor protein MecA [Lachnospiraceae bacterium]